MTCALATARITRSTPRVSPGVSIAHLSSPALIPVPAIPSTMSLTKRATIGSGVAQQPWSIECEGPGHFVEGMDAGRDDDVEVRPRCNLGKVRYVATEAQYCEIDDGVDTGSLDGIEFRGRPGDRL